VSRANVLSKARLGRRGLTLCILLLSFLCQAECAALARCVTDSRTGLAAYATLVPLLTSSREVTSPGSAACWTLLDVLGCCFSSDPDTRPAARGLLRHPFFDLAPVDEEAALRDAETIAVAPLPVPRWVDEHVLRPLGELLKAVEVPAAGKSAATPPPLDLGALAELLRVVAELVREDAEGSRVVDHDLPGVEPRWLLRHRPALVDEVMRRGALEGLAVVATRLLTAEDAAAVLAPAVGFLEGDRALSVAVRLTQRLERLAQALLMALRTPTSAMSRHAGVVLRFITMMYAGRTDPLPLAFSRSSASSGDTAADAATAMLVGPGTAIVGSAKKGVDRLGAWRPALAALFRPVLLEAVTEEGGGNWLYPSLRHYLHWCSLVADEVVDVAFDPATRAFACEAGSFADDRSPRPGPTADVVGVPFVRTAAYFRALLSVSGQLDVLSPGPASQSRFLAKSRAAACAFFAQMCRLDKESPREGGDEFAGARGRLGASADQRAQLLVDLGLAKVLWPWVSDPTHAVRAAALQCAHNALVTGLALSGSGSFKAEVGGGCNGGYAGVSLAASFCGVPWTAAFARVLRAPLEPTPGVGGFVFEDKALAVAALGAMAAAGGRAVDAWATADVPLALAAALKTESSKAPPSRQDTAAHVHARLPIGKAAAPSHRPEPGGEPKRQKLDVRGVLEKLRVGAPNVLRAAAAASPTLRKVLVAEVLDDGFVLDGSESPLMALEAEARGLVGQRAAHAMRTIAAFLRRESFQAGSGAGKGQAPAADHDDSAEDVSAPLDLKSTKSMRRAAGELWRVAGWLSRFRALVRSALAVNDASVLGDSAAGAPGLIPRSPPELLLELARHGWGWALVCFDVLALASPVAVNACSESLAAVASAGIELLHLLLHAKGHAAFCLLEVPPKLPLDLPPSDAEAPEPFDNVSGLSAFVSRLGRPPRVFESSRPNAQWPLVAQLLDAFSAGLTEASDQPDVDRASRVAGRRLQVRLVESGLGLRLGDALKAHAALVRAAVAQRCEALQLAGCYLALRAGLRRLWLAVLRRPGDVRLIEQVSDSLRTSSGTKECHL